MIKTLIFYFYFFFPFLQGACLSGILDLALHDKNKALCVEVVNSYLQGLDFLSLEEKACYLSSHLDKVAEQLLLRGLNLTIYSYGTAPTGVVFFSAIALWEGKNFHPSFPLSLFIYGWPPEDYAKKCHSPCLNYLTPIHSHPLSCAFTVLEGRLIQELFVVQEPLKSRKPKKIKEEVLIPGKLVRDKPSSFFIHRIRCQGNGNKGALSLHAYGGAEADFVQKTFKLTAAQFVYE